MIYALGSIVGKAVGLVMVPILTRLLSPAEYGRVDVLTTLGSSAISALLLGMDVAATRLFFDVADQSARKRLLATWCALAGVIVVPFGLGLILFASNVSEVLFSTANYGPAVAAVGLVTVFGTYHHIALTTLRAMRRPGLFATISAATLALNAALVIWLLLAWNNGVTAVIAGFAISLMAAGSLGLFLARDQFGGRPGGQEARSLLRLGLPLAPAIAAAWGAEFANRAILLGTSGPEDVALLAIALRIASVAGLAVAGFQLAWQPHAFAGGSSPSALARLALDSRRILIGVAGLVGCLGLLAPEIVAVAGGSAYVDAIPAVGVSLVGAFAGALYLVTSMPSALARRMGDLGVASTVGVVVSVGANSLLAPSWGAAGTATALALSPVVAAITAHRYGSKRVVVPIRWTRLLPVLGLVAAVTMLATIPEGGLPRELRILLGALVLITLVTEGTLGEVVRYIRGRAWS